ncbi:hypothetical protein D3C71_2201030 [compost metagenome]
MGVHGMPKRLQGSLNFFRCVFADPLFPDIRVLLEELQRQLLGADAFLAHARQILINQTERQIHF